MNRPIRFEVHLGADEVAAMLREDVRSGLTASPKSIPPKWFYDEAGSRLFDEITRLPEYYPTRCEREILEAHATDIAGLARADVLVELGSGTSDKTRLLLDAMEPGLRQVVLLDVSESTLRDAASKLSEVYAGVELIALAADFEHHMPHIPSGGRRLVAFLGGTIGNFRPRERARFLAALRDELAVGDHFVLGTDLVKGADRLVRAYDDSAGVTAAFNKNVLAVINRELTSDFKLDRFAHRAIYDSENQWIEMRLVSIGNQTVEIADPGIAIEFADGEEVLTEISAKFTHGQVDQELDAAGFDPVAWWTDSEGDFAVSLWAAS